MLAIGWLKHMGTNAHYNNVRVYPKVSGWLPEVRTANGTALCH